jgi:Outer membrane protein beta-barrel domain
MKLRNALLISLVIFTGLAAFAQDYSKAEVALFYTYARFNPTHDYTNSYSLNGGGGSFDYNFTKYIGFKGEFTGYASNNQSFVIPKGSPICPEGCSGTAQANLFTYLFGPQIGIRSGTFRPFGHFLLGGAHSNLAANLYNRVGYTARPSNDAFAFAFGGGLDIAVNHSGTISVRPAEIDYLYTNFDIGGNGAAHNFRYQGGIVFNF